MLRLEYDRRCICFKASEGERLEFEQAGVVYHYHPVGGGRAI